jgi:hypothetical protein
VGGFIGGHLVKVLQERGHKKIRAVDVKPLNEWYQKRPGVENQVGDLALLEPCRTAAKGARTIYNLAADMGGMGFIETHKAECMLISSSRMEGGSNLRLSWMDTVPAARSPVRRCFWPRRSSLFRRIKSVPIVEVVLAQKSIRP